MAIGRLRARGNDSAALERMGLQPSSEGIPERYVLNPGYCPRLLDDSCNGACDKARYQEFCDNKEFYYHYSKCELFQIEVHHPVEACQAKITTVSDPLSDTVIMHGDELVTRHTRKPSQYDASLHDRIADGEDPRKSGWFLRAVGGVE